MGVGLIPLELDLGPLAPAHFSEFVVGALLAVLIAFGVHKFVVPMFEAMYDERTAQIEGSINRAQQIQAEADAAKREYQDQLAASQSEAASIRDQARERAAGIVAEAQQRGQREYERQLEAARSQIEAEKAQAFNELKAEVGALAIQLSEKIVGEQLSDPNGAQRSIDRFLDDLERQPSRVAPDYVPTQLGE